MSQDKKADLCLLEELKAEAALLWLESFIPKLEETVGILKSLGISSENSEISKAIRLIQGLSPALQLEKLPTLLAQVAIKLHNQEAGLIRDKLAFKEQRRQWTKQSRVADSDTGDNYPAALTIKFSLD